jgi:phospholipid N-methyltransferase
VLCALRGVIAGAIIPEARDALSREHNPSGARVANLANKPDTAQAARSIAADGRVAPRDANPGSASTGSDGAAFLRGFLDRPREVGSIVPSSSFLEAQIVAAAAPGKARCVVELGPGTGGSTRALLRALPAEARLLAVELNPGFCERLNARLADPRLVVQAGSAEDLAAHLARWNLPAPEAVVSGIPFSTMPQASAERIAAAIHAVLKPGGCFVAYQFRPHVARYLARHLGAPEVTWEWRNIPPMRVFRWVKPPG